MLLLLLSLLLMMLMLLLLLLVHLLLVLVLRLLLLLLLLVDGRHVERRPNGLRELLLVGLPAVGVSREARAGARGSASRGRVVSRRRLRGEA